MLKLLNIITITNDAAQYAAMRESFLSAGFDDARCTYTALTNYERNIHDPYEVITAAAQETCHRYIVICHQDVRIDRGHDIEILVQRLEELDRTESAWGVAGNAGVDPMGRMILRITDPSGLFEESPLPRRVMTLDENFLVLRPRMGIRCSGGLRGFHLYGADLCFNAMAKGFTCHVIDFHLRHLSAGNSTTDAFSECLRQFEEYWNTRVLLGIANTCMNTPLRVSSNAMLRRLLQSRRLVQRLRRRGVVFDAKFAASEQPQKTPPLSMVFTVSINAVLTAGEIAICRVSKGKVCRYRSNI